MTTENTGKVKREEERFWAAGLFWVIIWFLVVAACPSLGIWFSWKY